VSGGEQGVQNFMDGRAEIALQARDIHGGVHVHGREYTLPARQVRMLAPGLGPSVMVVTEAGP
jgi:hypothetical protein